MSETIVVGLPTTLEQVLDKTPSEWTEDEWKIVRSGIEEGVVLVLKWFPITIDPRAYPIPMHTLDEREKVCAIARFFRDNPNETSVSMTCNCKYCMVWCADTSQSFTLA